LKFPRSSNKKYRRNWSKASSRMSGYEALLEEDGPNIEARKISLLRQILI